MFVMKNQVEACTGCCLLLSCPAGCCHKISDNIKSFAELCAVSSNILPPLDDRTVVNSKKAHNQILSNIVFVKLSLKHCAEYSRDLFSYQHAGCAGSWMCRVCTLVNGGEICPIRYQIGRLEIPRRITLTLNCRNESGAAI